MSDFEAAGSLFSFDEEADAYTAVVNGVEFLCDDVEEGYDEEARRMAELYPEKLPEMVARAGAKSTDLQSPESAEHLCAKCGGYAGAWDGTAERLWACGPHGRTG